MASRKSRQTFFRSPIFITIATFIVLFLVFWGFYSKNYNSNTNQTDIISDETANWKAYANSEFKFSFKYPTDWEITNAYDPKYSPDLALNLGIIPLNKSKGSSVTPIYGLVYDNPNNLSLQEWQEKYNANKPMSSNFYSTDSQETTIAGYTAYLDENAGLCDPMLCDRVIIMAKDRVFIFNNVKLNDNYTEEELESNKEIFDQILSTFRFD